MCGTKPVTSARPPAGVPHVCYCFTPMRYAWHMQTAYFGDGDSGLKRLKAQAIDAVLSRRSSNDIKVRS